MKSVFTAIFSLALSAVATAAPAEETISGETMTDAQKAVLTTVETMTTAFQKGDISTVMASYEDGATIVFEPGAPVSDADQLRQMFSAMAAVNPVFDFAGHDVVVSGDLAVHIAPWSMTGRDPEGNDIAQSGLSVVVLRRQPDGNWKMAIDNPHGGALLGAE